MGYILRVDGVRVENMTVFGLLDRKSEEKDLDQVRERGRGLGKRIGVV